MGVKQALHQIQPRRDDQTELPVRRAQGLFHFVGQEAELVRLRTSFERAQQGERQVVFLFGEPGIGKAT